MSHPLLIVLIATVLCACQGTVTQAQEIKCKDSIGNWVFNSLGQSPCDVAARLESVCNNSTGDSTGSSLPPLDPNNPYLAKDWNNTPCVCNTVFYSLVSACTLCQGDTLIQWSEFEGDCQSPGQRMFPLPIPPGTAVPHYAYLDVTQFDLFNSTLAQSEANPSLDSLPVPGPTSASSFTSNPVSSSTPSPSQAPAVIVKKATSTAAIAGGVVGGFVGLSLIFGALLYVRKYKNHAKIKYDIDPPSPRDEENRRFSTAGANITPFMTQATTLEFPPAYAPSDPRTSVISLSSAGHGCGTKSERLASNRPTSNNRFSDVHESEIGHGIRSSVTGH